MKGEWTMHFELREIGAAPSIRAEVLPCRFKYEGAARIFAHEQLVRRFGDTATLRHVLQEDEA